MDTSGIQLPDEESFDPELRRAFEFIDEVDPKLIDYSRVKMHKDSIKLSGDGTFYTLQGEGPTMGLPCVFVRTHICNLKCDWCDAFYTWNPRAEEFWTDKLMDLHFNEAAGLIRNTWRGPPHIQKRVIFTGGEPLIQRKQIDEVWQTLNRLEFRNNSKFAKSWKVEIETNGTLMPTPHQLQYAQFNCSPKLANSHNREGSRIKPKILEALNRADTTFKFVCWEESDLDEIEEKYLPHIDRDKVIIMPQGIRSPEIDKNMQALYEPCMERGYRLMGRMQAQFADGARRAV